MTPADVQRNEIHLPTRAIVKPLLIAPIVWAGLELWPEFVLLFVACILAIAIEPAVDSLDRQGLSRAMSVLICAMLVGVIADHGALDRAVPSSDHSAVESVLRTENHPEERSSRRPAP